MKHKVVLNELVRCLLVIVSSAVYSLAVLWFLEPCGLISIGMTGLGQITTKILAIWNIHIPLGVFTFVFNVPLCIYGMKSVSPKFIIYTILSIVVQSVTLLGWVPMIDIGVDPETNKLFYAIIAGLIGGVGIGLALRFGTSTGGVDILAQAINLKHNFSIGFISTVVNILFAVIGGGLMEGRWDLTFYTFIFIIITNIVVDKVHTAYNYLRVDIVSLKREEVAQALLEGINRGCTFFEVEGAYTRERKSDIFMVISSYELDKAKNVIKEIDPDAFIIVSPVKRIIGRFFKHTII